MKMSSFNKVLIVFATTGILTFIAQAHAAFTPIEEGMKMKIPPDAFSLPRSHVTSSYTDTFINGQPGRRSLTAGEVSCRLLVRREDVPHERANYLVFSHETLVVQFVDPHSAVITVRATDNQSKDFSLYLSCEAAYGPKLPLTKEIILQHFKGLIHFDE